MNKWKQGGAFVTSSQSRSIGLLRGVADLRLVRWMWRGGMGCVSLLAILTLLPARCWADISQEVPSAPDKINPRELVPGDVPWLALIGVALGLGIVGYIVLRVSGVGRKHSSGRKSRGGWLISNSGLEEIHASSEGEEESSGSSSNFVGGGAGSNW